MVKGGVSGAGKLVYREGEAVSICPSEHSMAERQLCAWLPLSVAGPVALGAPGLQDGTGSLGRSPVSSRLCRGRVWGVTCFNRLLKRVML